MHLKKKNQMKLIATLLLAMFLPCVAKSQVTIGDITAPQSFSLLEISTANQEGGLRFPQLTTEQRDALTQDADFQLMASTLAKGLTIVNITTNCLEYWDGDKWISLCQDSTNSDVDIPVAACNNIYIYGIYYKNSPLNNTHYIVLPVTVNKKGNYSIIATSNNGYYFQANGVFEETGVFELRLEGMGTPGINQIDQITFACNGKQISSLCNVTIDVEALSMGYRINCNNIEVTGSYQTRRFMDGDNLVKIPIEVLQTGVTTVWTDVQNGLKFNAIKSLNTYGADTLILKAEGSPKQEGTFTFTFTTDGSIKTTCSFTVDCFSKLGTFDDPACNCLAIYEERPYVTNGEYWLQDCKDPNFPATRTYCDITGGGWTLVWSFSEKTARNTYVQNLATGGTANANRMEVSGAYWGVHQSRPTNRITTSATNDGPTDYRINYENFRLNRNEWLNLSSGDRSQLKVRIAESPTDMNDEWALNNYGIITPRNTADNPILSTYAARANVPAVGKIYGKRWEVRPIGGNFGGWDELSGSRAIAIYNNDAFCTHWDWIGGVGSTTQFQVIPDRGGANNTIAMSNINNGFGWFGETESNHHFGKCNNGTGANDDYGFGTKTCLSANLVPHSFNNGEGRYLQWFVK